MQQEIALVAREVRTVSIVTDGECCQEARFMKGHRRDPEAAPKHLPLPGCTMRDGCRCRFEVHSQCLDDATWRKVVDDMHHGRPAGGRSTLPLNRISHSPRVAADPPSPAGKLASDVSPLASLLAIALTVWLVYASLT